MKINRLLSIVIMLINKESVTAREFANKFEVSTRTIYRDIDILSQAGIPIYANKGYKGGISLIEGYTLNRTIISDEEKEGIFQALKTIQVADYPDASLLINKLGMIFKQNKNNDDWIEIDFTIWGSGEHDKKKFNMIKKAILDKYKIEIDYINGYNQNSNRIIYPQKLLFKGTTWYLWANCMNSNSMRMFRFSRIKSVKLLTEKFEENYKEFDEQKQYEEENNGVKLKLKFHSDVLYRLYDDFSSRNIKVLDDGYYIVEVIYPIDEWVYGYLLSYGHYVEVIKPEFVRDEIVNRSKKITSIYKG